MTDRELEGRIRAWYAAEVGDTETAPDDLRDSLGAIPATTPTPLRARDRRRGFTLLAVAAVLVAGGALAAGSGVIRPRPAVTPAPNVAVVAPSASPAAATPAPTPNVRPGTSIAYIRTVEKTRDCFGGRTTCATPRLWIVGSDGQGAHELFPDGVTFQGLASVSTADLGAVAITNITILAGADRPGRPTGVDSSTRTKSST